MDGTKRDLPQEARGNPVYEQTRQDMPFWCCGINCGINSRYVQYCTRFDIDAQKFPREGCLL